MCIRYTFMFIKKKVYNKKLKPIYSKPQPKKLEAVPLMVDKIVQVKEDVKVETKQEKMQSEEKKNEASKKKKQNKNTNKKKNMADSKLKQVEKLLNDAELPERKVKIEKKEKGLYERTENSTILLTEDNKMVLND